jgi:hypothetical protein
MTAARAIQSAVLMIVLALVAGALAGLDGRPASRPTDERRVEWKNGPPVRPDFFPLAVWLQQPTNAPKFRALGINTYVGLWKGPTEAQLAELRKHGMYVICSQNMVGLAHLNDPTIIGWMHGDEPDNAKRIEHWPSAGAIRKAWPNAPRRTLKQWGAYGPPIPPHQIVADYRRIRRQDPTRPVLLNLGQGVAFDGYIGRGYRRGKLEDYPEYVKGCDIVSFDIYPVVHRSPKVAGRLEYVARGVERLRKWTHGRKRVWNCIETTHISNPPAIASPEQIRSEVWMSIIHGSRGIIYFVHEFEPHFIEAGLLAHPKQAEAVKKVNRQILSLAPAINALKPTWTVRVDTADPNLPVATMAREHNGGRYVFAAAMRDGRTVARFDMSGIIEGQAKVIGEDRSVRLRHGQFEDRFGPYEVHLYRIGPSTRKP